MASRNRVVEGDGVAVNIDTGQRRAALWCQPHTLGVVLDLDADEFGHQLARFFTEHEDCSGAELPARRPPLD